MVCYLFSSALITLLSFLFFCVVTLSFVFQVYIFTTNTQYRGARGSVVVKALCYILEGRGFDSR
jgi:hypothetical protein